MKRKGMSRTEHVYTSAPRLRNLVSLLDTLGSVLISCLIVYRCFCFCVTIPKNLIPVKSLYVKKHTLSRGVDLFSTVFKTQLW